MVQGACVLVTCWWYYASRQRSHLMKHIPCVFKLLGKGSPLIGRLWNGEHFVLVDFHDGLAYFWHHMADGCSTAPELKGERRLIVPSEQVSQSQWQFQSRWWDRVELCLVSAWLRWFFLLRIHQHLLMRPRHFARSCAICFNVSLGILTSLKEALRVSLYHFFWPSCRAFSDL